MNNEANKGSELLLMCFFFSLPGRPPHRLIYHRIHRATPGPTNGSAYGGHGRDEALAAGVSGWMGEVDGPQLEPDPTQDRSIPG